MGVQGHVYKCRYTVHEAAFALGSVCPVGTLGISFGLAAGFAAIHITRWDSFLFVSLNFGRTQATPEVCSPSAVKSRNDQVVKIELCAARALPSVIFFCLCRLKIKAHCNRPMQCTGGFSYTGKVLVDPPLKVPSGFQKPEPSEGGGTNLEIQAAVIQAPTSILSPRGRLPTTR